PSRLGFTLPAPFRGRTLMRGKLPALVAGWLAVTPFALAQTPTPPPTPYSPSQWAAGVMNSTGLSNTYSAPETRSATVWRFSKAAGSSAAVPSPAGADAPQPFVFPVG